MRQQILDRLPQGHPWRKTVECHPVLPSTNDQAKALARQGAAEGTVVIARTQTAGRGRLGRSFYSPDRTGLYFSVILRPQCPPSALMHLTCAAAVAACDAVEQVCGIRPGIKWINDLTLGSRKLGGILTELSMSPDATVDYAVIGIGINCTGQPFPEELKDIACSLPCAEPSDLAAALIVTLEQMRRDLLTQPARIMERYRQNCVTLGRTVRVISPSETRTAQAVSVSDDGALTVRFPDGSLQQVNCGEVSVRGLWDYV